LATSIGGLRNIEDDDHFALDFNLTFDRGTGESAVSCIMLDPEFRESQVGYTLMFYSATLVEQNNP